MPPGPRDIPAAGSRPRACPRCKEPVPSGEGFCATCGGHVGFDAPGGGAAHHPGSVVDRVLRGAACHDCYRPVDTRRGRFRIVHLIALATVAAILGGGAAAILEIAEPSVLFLAAMPLLVGAAGAMVVGWEAPIPRCGACTERRRRMRGAVGLLGSPTARRLVAVLYAIIIFIALVHVALQA